MKRYKILELMELVLKEENKALQAKDEEMSNYWYRHWWRLYNWANIPYLEQPWNTK